MKLPISKTLAVAAVVAASLMAQVTTLSQSSSITVTAGNSIACASGASSVPAAWTTWENSYFRSYSLSGVGGNIDIVSVRIGVESCVPPAGGTLPMIIRLFLDSNGGTPSPYSSLTLKHTENFSLGAMNGVTVVVPMTGPRITFTTSQTLVVELTSSLSLLGTRFFIGSNTASQSGVGYSRSLACGVTDPTSLASAPYNSPNMHIILDVSYVPAGTGVPYPGTQDDLAMYTGVNNAPLTSGYNNYIKSANAGNTVQVKIASPDGGLVNRQLVLIAEGFNTGVPPFPPAAANVWCTLNGMIFLIGTDYGLLGAITLPVGGTTVSFTVPFGLSGHSFLLQGAIVTPSAPFALNGVYATTHGHVFQL